MSPETIALLNNMNKRFYEITAENFDATRQYPWQGWENLLTHIPIVRPLRVLDIGCGNGRFGLYLRDKLEGEIHYTGLDNNPKLLEFAQHALSEQKNMSVTLENVDVIAQADALPRPTHYDLVVAFGVVHHVPGWDNRAAFMGKMGACVAKGGVLAFAAWRFMDNERLKKRVIVWLPDMEREEFDYLLDWKRGENALRYCHYVGDVEYPQLIAATGLTEITTYRADGHDGQTNQYSVLRRDDKQ